MIEIPDGQQFKIGDREPFTLDILEALQKLNEINTECAAADTNNWKHVEKFRDWLAQTSGQQFTLKQADSVADACRLEYAREKKAVADQLSLPSSTEPPPSLSPQELDFASTPT